MGFTLAALAQPVLARIGPERAHRIGLAAIAAGLAGRDRRDDDPILAQTVLGRHFGNPVGIAAGFDKDAVAIRPLMALGFGFVEAGTVTPLPQPGNPRPRLFRLVEDQAVINRMGFNGAGLEQFRSRLTKLGPRPAPLGANIGINKDGAEPIRDYKMLVASLADLVDYIAINVSSPNTLGLRDLQQAGNLRAILDAVGAVVPRPPILVKIAPDLSEPALAELIEAVLAGGAQGLIIGNTTIARPSGLISRHAGEGGGLSGRPLFARSTAVLARAHRLAAGRLVLIGCGGVFSGADALAKIRAGASLVQLYTGFAYQGPALIPLLRAELAGLLRAEGFAHIGEAVGVDAARLAEVSWSD